MTTDASRRNIKRELVFHNPQLKIIKKSALTDDKLIEELHRAEEALKRTDFTVAYRELKSKLRDSGVLR
jgi:hypothetical protein